MPELSKEKVIEGFDKEGLLVMNDKNELWKFLQEQDYTNANLLLMSSGNYDGLDMIEFAKNITTS
jgi:UDP-N-acetylmuramate: L-alanyl-gamma-D-glutamyl-meso-diaminopimelate ligase